MSAQMLEMSLFGVGAVLRLERDAWSMVKWPRQAANKYPPPHPPPYAPQIREWSKRVRLDSAITNLPKMSSLILRWSLDNTLLPQEQEQQQLAPLSPPPPPPPLLLALAAPGSRTGGGAGDGGRARQQQRELRSSLQAFLEVRQVWRLLSDKGEGDPTVLSIAGEVRSGNGGRRGRMHATPADRQSLAPRESRTCRMNVPCAPCAVQLTPCVQPL